jgi:hypothetical protein
MVNEWLRSLSGPGPKAGHLCSGARLKRNGKTVARDASPLVVDGLAGCVADRIDCSQRLPHLWNGRIYYGSQMPKMRSNGRMYSLSIRLEGTGRNRRGWNPILPNAQYRTQAAGRMHLVAGGSPQNNRPSCRPLHSALHCKNHRPYNSLVNDCLLRN